MLARASCPQYPIILISDEALHPAPFPVMSGCPGFTLPVILLGVSMARVPQSLCFFLVIFHPLSSPCSWAADSIAAFLISFTPARSYGSSPYSYINGAEQSPLTTYSQVPLNYSFCNISKMLLQEAFIVTRNTSLVCTKISSKTW